MKRQESPGECDQPAFFSIQRFYFNPVVSNRERRKQERSDDQPICSDRQRGSNFLGVTDENGGGGDGQNPYGKHEKWGNDSFFIVGFHGQAEIINATPGNKAI